MGRRIIPVRLRESRPVTVGMVRASAIMTETRGLDEHGTTRFPSSWFFPLYLS